jgi:hypothetical protein
MPSPAGLFYNLFTVSQLQTMLQELAINGMITSIGGGAKSGGFSRLSPEQMGIELRAELNRLTGQSAPDRVQHILHCPPIYGPISFPQ